MGSWTDTAKSMVKALWAYLAALAAVLVLTAVPTDDAPVREAIRELQAISPLKIRAEDLWKSGVQDLKGSKSFSTLSDRLPAAFKDRWGINEMYLVKYEDTFEAGTQVAAPAFPDINFGVLTVAEILNPTAESVQTVSFCDYDATDAAIAAFVDKLDREFEGGVRTHVVSAVGCKALAPGQRCEVRATVRGERPAHSLVVSYGCWAGQVDYAKTVDRIKGGYSTKYISKLRNKIEGSTPSVAIQELTKENDRKDSTVQIFGLSLPESLVKRIGPAIAFAGAIYLLAHAVALNATPLAATDSSTAVFFMSNHVARIFRAGVFFTASWVSAYLWNAAVPETSAWLKLGAIAPVLCLVLTYVAIETAALGLRDAPRLNQISPRATMRSGPGRQHRTSRGH